MRKLVSSADNLETLEQLVTERLENDKLRDLKETLNDRIGEIKGEVKEEKEQMIFPDEDGLENNVYAKLVDDFEPQETEKSFIANLKS